MYNPNEQKYHRHCLCVMELPDYHFYNPDCSNCPYLKVFDEEFLKFAIALNENYKDYLVR